MPICACCARRGHCARPCPELERHLPSMRRGEMPVWNPTVMDALPAPETHRPGTTERVFQLLCRHWHVLTPRQQEVLLLLYVEGLTESEAGRRLGISQPMVYKHRRRALARISQRGL